MERDLTPSRNATLRADNLLVYPLYVGTRKAAMIMLVLTMRVRGQVQN
jgi:hypothetical protein